MFTFDVAVSGCNQWECISPLPSPHKSSNMAITKGQFTLVKLAKTEMETKALVWVSVNQRTENEDVSFFFSAYFSLIYTHAQVSYVSISAYFTRQCKLASRKNASKNWSVVWFWCAPPPSKSSGYAPVSYLHYFTVKFITIISCFIVEISKKNLFQVVFAFLSSTRELTPSFAKWSWYFPIHIFGRMLTNGKHDLTEVSVFLLINQRWKYKETSARQGVTILMMINLLLENWTKKPPTRETYQKRHWLLL